MSSSRSSSQTPAPEDQDEHVQFHIDVASPSPVPEAAGFILDTQGEHSDADATDPSAPPPPTSLFQHHHHSPTSSPRPAESSSHGLVLPEHARVTKEVTTAEPEDEEMDDRYFDEVEASNAAPLTCQNCGEPGHKMYKCPHTRCLACGAWDEHKTYECPLKTVCYRCGLMGHTQRLCRNKPQQGRGSGGARRGCDHCGSSRHSGSGCPNKWRIYAYLDDDEYDEERQMLFAEVQPDLVDAAFSDSANGQAPIPPTDWDPATRWCYNCASKGNHWGDECPLPRRQGWAMDYATIWSESVSRTGPFAHALADAPQLEQSIFIDDPMPSMRDPDSILDEYFARKSYARGGPRGPPANAPEGPKRLISLSQRIDPPRPELSKKEQKEADKLEAKQDRKAKKQRDKDRSCKLKAEKKARSNASTRGSAPPSADPLLDYGPPGDNDEEDWFDRRATKRYKPNSIPLMPPVPPKPKNSNKKDRKNRPTGTKKHQSDPRLDRPNVSANGSAKSGGSAPKFGSNDPFAFTFQPNGKKFDNSRASNSAPPRIDLTGDNTPPPPQKKQRPGRRDRRERREANGQGGGRGSKPNKAGANAPQYFGSLVD